MHVVELRISTGELNRTTLIGPISLKERVTYALHVWTEILICIDDILGKEESTQLLFWNILNKLLEGIGTCAAHRGRLMYVRFV